MAPLSFAHHIVAKCSYLCLFEAIIELHVKNEICSMTFSLESEHGYFL